MLAYHRLISLVKSRQVISCLQQVHHLSTQTGELRSSSGSTAKKIQSVLWTMPKEEKYLKSLKLKRMEKKNRRILDQPYKIYWQIVGAGGPGAPTSLFLYADTQCYFFNCGEGSQRMASFVTLAKSIAQTDNVFITSKTWKNLGGLPGICLTVRSYGFSEITVHGPPGCMDIYEATKEFLALLEFNVNHFKDKVYSDNVVNIQEVPLTRSSLSVPSEIHESWDPAPEESAAYESSVYAYVCSFIPRVGKLDVQKCVDAGVPPGPLLGQLKAGKDVTLEDGRVIKSSDVLGETSLATSSIILEVPDIEYFQALEDSLKLREAKNLENIFHFTPPSVARHPRYISWMTRFPANVRHVFLNEDSTGKGMLGVTAYQAKLRLLNTTIFPVLKGAEEDPKPGFDIGDQLIKKLGNVEVLQAIAGLKIHVRPSSTNMVEFEESLVYDESAVVRDALECRDIHDETLRVVNKELLDKELQLLQSSSASGQLGWCGEQLGQSGEQLGQSGEQLGQSGEQLANGESRKELNSSGLTEELIKEKIYPEITFLGTGSAIPSKYRNVSCILVEVEPDAFIILDCGEGSLSQLYSLRGVAGAERVLRNLKAIYLSHQHADHHLGTINVIVTREAVFQRDSQPVPKLYIVSTAKYRNFLLKYHNKIQSILSNAELIKCEELIYYLKWNENREVIPGPKHQLISQDSLKEFLLYSGLSEIETCRAVHCPHAFCVAIRTKAGYKITYSGDTRPTEFLVNLGRDSDVLIHEASMEQSMIQDAIIKKHSTFTEAIKEGKDMGAKFTLLTHFSQRYSKAPLLNEIEGHENVGIAFDNMVVNPVSMRSIPTLYPALKRFFHSEFKDMEDKSQALQFNHSDILPGLGSDVLAVQKTSKKEEIINKLNKKEEERQELFENLSKRKEKKLAKEVARKEAAKRRQEFIEMSPNKKTRLEDR